MNFEWYRTFPICQNMQNSQEILLLIKKLELGKCLIVSTVHRQENRWLFWSQSCFSNSLFMDKQKRCRVTATKRSTIQISCLKVTYPEDYVYLFRYRYCRQKIYL